jgi:hypothetical protein
MLARDEAAALTGQTLTADGGKGHAMSITDRLAKQ